MISGPVDGTLHTNLDYVVMRHGQEVLRWSFQSDTRLFGI